MQIPCHQNHLENNTAIKTLIIKTVFFSSLICVGQFQEISILPPQKGLEFLGGGGSRGPKNLKKCMKLNWNFQTGGGC